MLVYRRYWILVLIFISLPAASVEFSSAELAMLKAAGPWPPRVEPDPGNRFSADPKAIELGEVLFREPGLSRNGTISCATCHDPESAYVDNLALSPALGLPTRHTPTVLNTAVGAWFGWGGEADSLWAQSIRPILSKVEMDGAGDPLRALFEQDENYRLALTEMLESPPEALADETLLVFAGKVLAAYQETLITDRSAFDEFRDALVGSDGEKAGLYPAAAARGAKIFFGGGGCSLCHFGPNFSNGEFASIALPHMTATGRPDKGRYGGIQQVKTSAFNRLGVYDDDSAKLRHWRTRGVKQRHDAFGEFKVPALRSVAKTAPYMHDGSLATLQDVVRHYNLIDLERLHMDGESTLRPLGLSEAEIDDLVAFLATL